MKKTNNNTNKEKKTNKIYETELPLGYEQVCSINALDKKTGAVLNLVGFAVMAVVIIAALVPVKFDFTGMFLERAVTSMVSCVVFLVATVAYIVLHELVHGAAYKLMTGQKLTFGIGWSCAFCGVPEIYTYRMTALVALAAPVAVFSVVLVSLTVWLFSQSMLMYFLSSLLLAFHFGGCCGDIYIMCLLLTKYKDKALLIRDAGAEQWLYLPKK